MKKYPKIMRLFRLGYRFDLAGENDQNAMQYMRVDVVKEREKKLIEAAVRVKRNLNIEANSYASCETLTQVIWHKAGLEELK
jgi:hypothetical protein